MKPILVCSHERSGTHFLISSIANCFNMSNEVINLPDKSREFNNHKYENIINEFMLNHTESLKILKSHHDVRFFKDWIFDSYNVIYIHRNYLDVLTSCYYYYKQHYPYVDFPFDNDIDNFLFNVKPYKHSTDQVYSYEFYENNILRLKNHISHWLNSNNRIHFVEYEELHQDFNKQIQKIAVFLKENVFDFKKPKLTGVSPRKGIIGDHTNLLNKDQILQINDTWSDK